MEAVRATVREFVEWSTGGHGGRHPIWFKEPHGILRGVDEIQFSELWTVVGDTKFAEYVS